MIFAALLVVTAASSRRRGGVAASRRPLAGHSRAGTNRPDFRSAPVRDVAARPPFEKRAQELEVEEAFLVRPDEEPAVDKDRAAEHEYAPLWIIEKSKHEVLRLFDVFRAPAGRRVGGHLDPRPRRREAMETARRGVAAKGRRNGTTRRRAGTPSASGRARPQSVQAMCGWRAELHPRRASSRRARRWPAAGPTRPRGRRRA